MGLHRFRILVAALVCVLIYISLIFFLPAHLALAATLTVAIVEAVYIGISPKQLPNRKPRWVWFPKYRFACELSESIMTSSDPGVILSQRLGEIGFTIEKEDGRFIKFTRGHPKGDFVIEFAKVNVILSLPIQNPSIVLVEYGWVCLFDTGDLWKFAQELRHHLHC